MDWKFLGVTDIVIVLLFIGFVVIGAKKGFLKKFVGLASGLVGLLLAFFFCSDFANLLIDKGFIYPSIQQNVYTNIFAVTNANPDSTIADILNNLGLPSIISDYIGPKIQTSVGSPEALATAISTEIAKMFMAVISFIMLFIIICLGVAILKLLISLLRKSVIIKVADGFLGVIFYGVMGIITIYLLLFVVSLVIQIPQLSAFNEFMKVDMQLETDAFRLSKYFYENNILSNLLKILF